MRQNPSYALDDVHAVSRLVGEYPFVTLVSSTAGGLVASHYPVIVESADPLVLLGHVGRPDEEVHELGRHEVLVIVQGVSGYVSPGWYGDRSVPAVPTWNFVVAHLSGTPEILSPGANLRALGELVAASERPLPEPRRFPDTPVDAEYAQRISAGTVGFRLPVVRWTAKAKLSQDKSDAVVAGVLAGLDGDGPYANPALAAAIRDARG